MRGALVCAGLCGTPGVKNFVIYASTLSCKLGEISIDVPFSTKMEPLSYFCTFIEKWCPFQNLNKSLKPENFLVFFTAIKCDC